MSKKEIGTAPEHNENQDYTPLVGKEPKVFAEDLNWKVPESECEKVGDQFWSKGFLYKLDRDIYTLSLEVEKVACEWEFFNQCNGKFKDEVVADSIQMIEKVLLPLLKSHFEKLGVDFETEKKGCEK